MVCKRISVALCGHHKANICHLVELESYGEAFVVTPELAPLDAMENLVSTRLGIFSAGDYLKLLRYLGGLRRVGDHPTTLQRAHPPKFLRA